MGTNFYFIDSGNDKEVAHIGKRSAAGLYCWDCGLSLCDHAKDSNSPIPGRMLYGSDAVHHVSGNDGWFDACPLCGNKYNRELGFNNCGLEKTGIKICCSFSFAIRPKDLLGYSKSLYFKIEDEYGWEYTIKNFQTVLNECPIKYYHSVGVEFF